MKRSPITLSVCLIARDEEASLGRCLESVRPIADEIVLVDTGSVDGTVGIAESFGATVGTFAWCDDFAAARNATLDLASGKFVLSIDADEWLPPETQDRIAALKSRYADTWRWAMLVVTIEGVNAAGSRYAELVGPRIFPRVGTTWIGRIHEFPENARFPRETNAAIKFVHAGYEYDQAEKAKRNLQIVREGFSQAKSETETCHYALYLAIPEESASGLDRAERLKLLQRCLIGGNPGIRTTAADVLSDLYVKSDDHLGLIETFAKLPREFNAYAWTSLVSAYLETGDDSRARAEFSKLHPVALEQLSRGALAHEDAVKYRMSQLALRLQQKGILP